MGFKQTKTENLSSSCLQEDWQSAQESMLSSELKVMEEKLLSAVEAIRCQGDYLMFFFLEMAAEFFFFSENYLFAKR